MMWRDSTITHSCVHGVYDNIMVFFDLPPCCVDESHSSVYRIYSHRALRSKVDVLVNVHASFNESIIRNFCKGHFNILPMGVHSCSCSSQI